MTTWTLEREQAAQARCDAATPGPWLEGCDPHGHPIVCSRTDTSSDTAEIRQGKLNLAFIDNARTDLPDALAEIRRLRDRVQSLVSVLRSIEFSCEPGNCPACGERDVGRGNCHTSDCRIFAALKG